MGRIIAKQEQDILFIDTFLLSCRVLGRGVEYAFLKEILTFDDRKSPVKNVKIEYIETQRNIPVKNFINQTVSEFLIASDGNECHYKVPIERLKNIEYRPVSLETGNHIKPMAKNKGSQNHFADISSEHIDFIVNHFNHISNIGHTLFGEGDVTPEENKENLSLDGINETLVQLFSSYMGLPESEILTLDPQVFVNLPNSKAEKKFKKLEHRV